MKYHRKNLLNLLQASQNFLDNPEDEARWLAFQKTLKTVEDAEKAEALAEQPENLQNPDTRRLLRRYYEEDFKARNRTLLRVSSIAALFILGTFLVLAFANNDSPMFFAVQRLFGVVTDTPTATLTLSPTYTETPSPTRTFTATPTRTATTTLAPTSTPTSTLTPSPTSTPRPSRTPLPTPTPIPLLTSQRIDGNLSSESLSQRHIFRGQMGDIITVHLDSEDFDPYLSIQDSSGDEIASNDDCGSLRRACIGPIPLPADDVYIILVDSYSRQETGAYTLEITLVSRANCVTQVPRVIVTTNESIVNLRGGPGRSYATISPVYNGECFTLIGRNANNAWLKIRTPSGRTGWILANLTQLEGEISNVPVVD